MTPSKSTLFPEILNVINALSLDSISDDRKLTLQPLIDFVQLKVLNDQEIRLNFICTHNSRRSHLSQVWAQTMAHYFAINKVDCYSAGTEATALFPMVVQTLQHSGFVITALSNNQNPIYSIKYANNVHPVIGFSKELDNDFNPKSGFAAIMTCNSADEACPIVPGAERRIPIMYKDPKVFDQTPQQAKKYSERSLQIATELYYVFSKINP